MRDVLKVIDAAYRFQAGADWLRELAIATNEQIGVGRGLLAFSHRVDNDAVRLGDAVMVDVPEEILPHTKAALESLPPWYVRKTFVRCECTTRSDAHAQVGNEDVAEHNKPGAEMMAQMMGIHDVLMMG